MNYLFYLKKWNFTKQEKLIRKRKDKEKYSLHVRSFKQALNHRLKSKKVHGVVKCNQKDR